MKAKPKQSIPDAAVHIPIAAQEENAASKQERRQQHRSSHERNNRAPPGTHFALISNPNSLPSGTLNPGLSIVRIAKVVRKY